MTQTFVERAADHITESTHHAARATAAIGDAIGNGVEVMRRTAKHGGEVAEDLLNDTTRRLQRNPAITVAATFLVGIFAGALIGWMAKRS